MEALRAWRRTSALLSALLLSGFLGEAAVVRVFCQPGHGVTLPCFYPYEDRSALPQLSVQWRGPGNQLLCHYIKHKGFQRCSEGYHMTYRPGSITLTIQQVRPQDYGPHVCSVSKRDEFLDYSVELARASDPSRLVTSAPNGRQNRSGPSWTLVLMVALTLSDICL